MSAIPKYDAENAQEAFIMLLDFLKSFNDTKLLNWTVDWAALNCDEAIKKVEGDILRHRAFGRTEEAARIERYLKDYNEAAKLIGLLRCLTINIAAEDFVWRYDFSQLKSKAPAKRK